MKFVKLNIFVNKMGLKIKFSNLSEKYSRNVLVETLQTSMH